MMQWIMFSKHLQDYPVERAAAEVAALGLDGLDLTVRPGGHIDPAEAERALPRALTTVRSRGLDVPLLTTAVTSADDPHAETIWATAAAGGVQAIKLGYWHYEGFGRLRQQLDAVRAALDGIERLALKHGVPAALHTHSGDYISASGPLVAELLRDRDPQALVAYADPGHLCAEGGLAGWKLSLDLLAPRLGLIAVKDMLWTPAPDASLGKMRWLTRLCPLNMGFVPWPEVFACLRRAEFDGIVSIHSEYQGSHSWRDLNTQQLLLQTRADLEYLWDAIGGKA